MTPIAVPTPESLHEKYAALLKRKIELDTRATDLRAQAAHLRRSIAGAIPSDDKAGRIDALLAGKAPVHSPTLADQLDDVLQKLRDVGDAQAELGIRIRLEYGPACRAVANTFSETHEHLLRKMWLGLAAAAEARFEIEKLQKAFRIAGVKFDGIHERGDVVFQEPINRTTRLALELRNAARDGIIDKKDVPECLR